MKREKINRELKFIYGLMACTVIAVTACEYIWPAEVPAEAEATTVTAEYHEQEPLFNVELDAPVQRFALNVCRYYGIEPSIVIALMEKESGFDAGCVGDNGESLGLMQVQEKWHGARMESLGATDLLDPYQNIEVGVNVLDEKIDEGNGLEWALMAYNGGNQYANEMTAAGKVSDYASGIIARASELEEERYAE